MGTLSATKYGRDLQNLGVVYKTACQSDLGHLVTVLSQFARRPLVTVGSGGSHSTASFASFLHEFHTRSSARTLTPLEMISTKIDNVGLLCFSAGGRNRDICTSFRLGAMRELRPLAALTLVSDSPLHVLGKSFSYSDVICFPSLIFRDGFLAVASLVATSVLLVRAYREVMGDPTCLPQDIEEFLQNTVGVQHLNEISERAESVVSMSYVSVLHTTTLKPAAIDLESRFVEAALGALHISDFRNFGHGRHHWFARRGPETGVLALIGDNQAKLAHRTLVLLPTDSPVATFQFEGDRDVQALAGLIVSLFVAEAAGRAVGVDPAKPGVPTFGRRIYRLGPAPKRSELRRSLFKAALHRKSPTADLSDKRTLAQWRRPYRRFLSTLETKRLGGIVFDYDGTLCDFRDRYNPLSEPVAKQLTHLLEEGCPIGVATGRGGSAGEALRLSLPEAVWDRVVVGYYNGSIVASLRDTDAIKTATMHHSLCVLQSTLSSNSILSGRRARGADRQLTIHLHPTDNPFLAVSAVQSGLQHHGIEARVLVSNHSLDIVLEGVSKLRVVDAVRGIATSDEASAILRIGDKGRWPGNDADLLNSKFGLSVDETSPRLDACWGLSPAGTLGVQATLYYLSKFMWYDGYGLIGFDDHHGRDHE